MKKQKNRRSFISQSQENAFEDFWKLYWLKKCKRDAQDAYIVKVKSTGAHRKVMDALRLQTPEMIARDATKRPYGATWLNGERWLDDVILPKGTKPPPKKPTRAEAYAAAEDYRKMWEEADDEMRGSLPEPMSAEQVEQYCTKEGI